MRYRANGKGRKIVFANYPGLPLLEARKGAIGLYGQVASGRDPGQERKASRRREVEAKAPVRDRVEKIAKAYLAHAKTRTRESTYLEMRRILMRDVLTDCSFETFRGDGEDEATFRARAHAEVQAADPRPLQILIFGDHSEGDYSNEPRANRS